ncbi:MAG: hypothetical protein M1433_02735 [Candidatus Parvarchaeota archaeon]|nr:hypothetical protein [Candidatus Parvarchaeota archaeon]
MVDIGLIAGIIIIIVAIITLVRIIKPLFEALIIIAIVMAGTVLVFHSFPIVGIPNFGIPISIGPNIMGANPGTVNTTDIVIFNAYTFTLGGFTATLNGKPVAILNNATSIGAIKFGVLVINSSVHGLIKISGATQLFGFNLGSMAASYNYT